MHPAALAGVERLAARHRLDDSQRRQLLAILGSLVEDAQAPTKVTEPAQAVDVHLADSLEVLGLEMRGLEALRDAGSIVDLGSGAGFPGLPVAVAMPRADVTLVESQARKCAFVERVVASAQIRNARVVCARAEEWPEGLGAHDVVMTRALASPAVVLEYAAPLLRLGGALVEWRGRRQPAEERAAILAAEQLGMRRTAVQRVEPFEGAHDRHLHVYLKESETPDRFPRRAGMARKRPLA